jgi:hypothetical protein
MAKKQTRRSISVSRTTYERLKAFCEANNISMSQLVETRVNDFLGGDVVLPSPSPISHPSIQRDRPMPSTSPAPAPRPLQVMPPKQSTQAMQPAPVERPMVERPVTPAVVPMTSAAARFAVEPPPPIIKSKQQEAAPKPAEKRPDQIFTF